MIDGITDPGICEFVLVDAPAAVTWPSDAPAIGVEREDVEDEISEALARGASFEFALEVVLYGDTKSWTKMPF